jgi:hypothetical protein
MLVLALTACGGDDGGEATDTSATSSSTSTSDASTTTTIESTIPEELRGRWQTVLPPPDSLTVSLTIGDRFYQIRRGGASAGTGGSVEAKGDRITFSRSSHCPGTGTYRWSLTEGKLQLASVAPDDCPSRAEVLDGLTYDPDP